MWGWNRRLRRYWWRGCSRRSVGLPEAGLAADGSSAEDDSVKSNVYQQGFYWTDCDSITTWASCSCSSS